MSTKNISKRKENKERHFIECSKRPKKNVKRECAKGRKKRDNESRPMRISFVNRRSAKTDTRSSPI